MNPATSTLHPTTPATGTTSGDRAAVFTCGGCGLDGGPFSTTDEAAQLAGIHNTLHHGGHPLAAVQAAPGPATRLDTADQADQADHDADDDVWAW